MPSISVFPIRILCPGDIEWTRVFDLLSFAARAVLQTIGALLTQDMLFAYVSCLLIVELAVEDFASSVQ